MSAADGYTGESEHRHTGMRFLTERETFEEVDTRIAAARADINNDKMKSSGYDT